jgi:hypothetical protein
MTHHPSETRWENEASSAPVSAFQTRRFLVWVPSSFLTYLSRVERKVPRGEKPISSAATGSSTSGWCISGETIRTLGEDLFKLLPRNSNSTRTMLPAHKRRGGRQGYIGTCARTPPLYSMWSLAGWLEEPRCSLLESTLRGV